MKSYQIKFENKKCFVRELARIKKACAKLPFSNIIFYLNWTEASRGLLREITDCIGEHFPSALYYGNEASGNILEGNLVYGIAITCYVFENEDTRTKLIWVEEGTEYGSLEDLWAYCRGEKGLKAVELIPSITYLDTLNIDNSVPDLSEDILIFGGASVNYDSATFEADIIATGHPLTRNGMAVMLYYGDEFHAAATYVLGWKGLGRLMKVTKSEGKVISEIDHVPAFSIYEKYLNLQEGDNANLVFPLIVEEDGVEYIRTPQLFLPDKSMRMFANIGKGTLTRIAYGDKNTILSSLYAKASEIENFRPQAIKAYSCAARRLFWGDGEISKETLPLEDIAPVCGFYTGGEILRFGRKLRVLNSTLSIISLREGSGETKKLVAKPRKVDKSLVATLAYFTEKIAEEEAELQKKMCEALVKAKNETQRNNLLYEIIGGGKWSYDFNAADEVIAAHYSDKTKKITDIEYSGNPMGWLERLHPEDRERVAEEFMAAIRDHSGKKIYDTTFRMVQKDGSYRWTKSAGRILRQADGSGELFGMNIEITEQIAQQERQKEQLAQALSMAQSADRAKTNFLFNMSHDIRTPMNAILGFTQMVQKNVGNREKVEDYIGKIEQSGHHLLGLINDVLEMSRIESGKITLDEVPVDVSEQRGALEAMLQNLAAEKKIALTFEVKNTKHPFLYLDALRMDQILINIISNAIKYTPEGGRVKCSIEHLDSANPAFARVRFTVADTGIGMSKEFVQTIFEPFSRAKSSTVSGIQGTGLGMSIVKKLVDLMGGTITVDSEPGKGTTVTVENDFRIAEKAEAKSAEKVSGAVDFTGKKVLLVEDNELNLEIAEAVLKENGFIVDTAEDGDIAVEKIKAAKAGDYDIILMDVQMPRMDGHEATRQIRALGTEISGIPILAMTANAFEEDRKAAIKAGMNEHIAKPINVEVLKATLAKFL